jgi:hypothetical protein
MFAETRIHPCMKKIIFLLLILLSFNHTLYAHLGGPPKGSPPPGAISTSTSPTSSSNAAQTGYVYHLKYRYHIKYKHDPLYSRYWYVTNDGIFTKHRLKVSITQDTTILKLGFIDVNFPVIDTIPKKDVRSITNPNYNSINGNALRIEINSINRQQINPSLPLTVSSELMKEKSKLLDLAQVSTKYKKLDRIINKIVKLDNVDFGPFMTVYNNSVTNLTMLPDTAIPLKNNDFSDSFYLQIVKKNILNKPIYFISLPYSAWDYGALTIPFRYRFARSSSFIATPSSKAIPSEEESDATLNLSTYFGRKWGRTRFYADPTMTHNTLSLETVVCGGPSLIPLSLSNIDSSSKEISSSTSMGKISNSYIGPANMIALSLGGGVVLGWQKFNVGFFSGYDFPLTPNTGWVYRKKVWLGFGIGVNLGMVSSGKSLN